MRKVTISETIVIRATPERVWDYTQDYALRPEWDLGVVSAEVVSGPVGPPRVRIRLRHAGQCIYQYKLFERPRRTTVAMQEVDSWILSGGGGAWTYESHTDGTRWTQTNTVVLRPRLASILFALGLRWQVRRSTRQAMRAAKRIIEGSETAQQQHAADGAARRR